MSDQTAVPLSRGDLAILHHGACALCTTDSVQVWHDGPCWQIEGEDDQS